MSSTVTKITLKSDRATGISATHNGANINGMAFNVDYIAQMSMDMAESIMSLYEAVRSLEREYKEEVV